MSLEEDLANSVPKRLREVKLPIDDDRTTFIACSTYTPIEGDERHHAKITRSEASRRNKEALGKLIVDYHNNNKLVGTVIDTALDKHNRIWVVGAINYDEAGIRVLDRMRKGHYNGVSWTMKHFSYMDPTDGDIRVEKVLVSLSVTSNPEYPETKIVSISDEPFIVKRNRLVNEFDNVFRTSFENFSKKQKVLPTESVDAAMIDNSNTWTMSETAPASAAAQTSATPTPASQAAPTTVAVDANATKQDTEKKQEPVQTQTYQPQQQPPVVNYNFGVSFPPQNQFNTPSTAQPAASQPVQPTPQMSTTTAEQKNVETPQTSTQQQQPTSNTPSSTTSSSSQSALMDEFRRSFMGDMKSMFTDMMKSMAPPPPPPQQQPAQPTAATSQQQQQPAPTQQPSSTPQQQQPAEQQQQNYTPVNVSALHDSIKQIVQLEQQVHDKQMAVDAMAGNSLISTEVREAKQNEVNELRSEMFESMSTLVEGVEQHYKNFSTTFKTPQNPVFFNTIVNMKDKISKKKPLSEQEMNSLGWAIELTSESSGKHKQVLEEAERVIQQQRAAMAQSNNTRSLEGRFSRVTQLREILGRDPQRGTKRQYESSSEFVEPPAQQRQKMASLTPTQQFRKTTGLMWSLANPAEFPNAPLKPTESLATVSHECEGVKFMPVNKCPDSIWANGLCDDPSFSSLINEGMDKISKGIDVMTYSPNIISYINSQARN